MFINLDSSGGETWEDGGYWSQEEVDEVDETEEARQAGGDTSDVAGQGNKAALCNSNISIVFSFCACGHIGRGESLTTQGLDAFNDGGCQ